MTAKQMYWCLCGGFCAIATGIAASSAYFTYTINVTESLPGTLYVVHKGAAIHRGDLVAFRWHGGGGYPAGLMFIKEATGIAGDVVTRDGARFQVNGTLVGIAKATSRKGALLVPAEPGVVPPGQVFVTTPSPDSLDSRYRLTGNIGQQRILGRAYAIF